MRAPAGSPPGLAGASSPTLLGLTAPAATGTGQGAGPFRGATAGPNLSALSVCLSDVEVAAAASHSAPSVGRSTTLFSRQKKTEVEFACRYSKRTDAQLPFE